MSKLLRKACEEAKEGNKDIVKPRLHEQFLCGNFCVAIFM